jgi:hypothetical protein
MDNLEADAAFVPWHSPFETIRSTPEGEGVSTETVYRRLTELLALRPRFLKWGSHFLKCDLERKGIELPKEVLDSLPFEEHTLFHRVITGDQSSSYRNYSSDYMWTRSTDFVIKSSLIE